MNKCSNTGISCFLSSFRLTHTLSASQRSAPSYSFPVYFSILFLQNIFMLSLLHGIGNTGNAALKQLFVRICRTEQLTDYFLHIAVYTYQAAKLNVIVHKLFPPSRTFLMTFRYQSWFKINCSFYNEELVKWYFIANWHMTVYEQLHLLTTTW